MALLLPRVNSALFDSYIDASAFIVDTLFKKWRLTRPNFQPI
jgi:hypothetical protein